MMLPFQTERPLKRKPIKRKPIKHKQLFPPPDPAPNLGRMPKRATGPEPIQMCLECHAKAVPPRKWHYCSKDCAAAARRERRRRRRLYA